jgi:outer membrane protein assembly factor BamB
MRMRESSAIGWRDGFIALALALISSSQVRAAAAAKWPQFRGPNCSGVSDSARPPVEFGPGTNLLWKTSVPAGLSSPCVWDDRIFLTTSSDQKLGVMCLRRTDGTIVWQRSLSVEQWEEINPDSSPASATPATDGQRVYVYFGSFGLLAYDFEGKEQWRKPLPLVMSLNGSGTSPVVIDGVIFVNRDQEEGKSSLLAVDAATGRTVWETPRPKFNSSYATPILWERGQERDVVLAGSLQVVAYDWKTGQQRWSGGILEALSVCPTPVLGDGQLYAASRSMAGMKLPGFTVQQKEMDANGDEKIARNEAKGMLGSKAVFNAIDENKDGFINAAEWDTSVAAMSQGEFGVFALGAPAPSSASAPGERSNPPIVWKAKRGAATVPSPLFYQGRLYLVQDGGRLTCYRAKSGEPLYEQERLDAEGQYWASPVAADGKVYFASHRGNMAVVAAADSLKVLARNKLGERISATPALAADQLYVRSAHHLWAFGERR